MSRKIVTGYSNKSDGLLVVTDKDLATLAVSFGFVHKQVRTEDFFVDGERLDNGEISEEHLAMIENGETPRGFFRMFVADFELDVNLYSAVCW